ncbi:adenylosuccinate lyase [Mariniflexile maritimum]|jgi:hypothetical protein|uniref:adenylosuccinate lyase n=1 Tax=Mariniflexile maritimum TaxID=2682493 RepID=UPI0012F67056|nr:adenylosuccinate lyase [Mariniflexile maritimum]
MTFEEFHKELTNVDASREKRLACAHLVLNDIHLFPELLSMVFKVNDKLSYRAAWVFEFVCEANVYALIPYLDAFCANLKTIRFDSAVRPMAKVCVFIAKEYYSKQPNTLKKTLKPKHKELIVEACFDWLIQDEKTSSKAYAMEVLYLFGKDYPWVYPELVKILEQDFQAESPGYKARAKRILQGIKKKQKPLNSLLG